MRIGFVTSVQLGLDCLWEISRLGDKLDLLITLRDDVAKKKSGRVYLDEYAQTAEVPLHKTAHINKPETIEAIRAADLDYLLVIGWSQLVDPKVFSVVNRSLLGVHPTLLPQGRGRAPIPWTILKGLGRSGVTLFELRPKADTGDIFASESFDVDTDETATTLYEKARKAHVDLIRRIWPKLKEGILVGVPQDDSRATYWTQRRPEDGEIKSDTDILEVEKLVRATTHPYPGAFVITDGRKLVIWSGRICQTEHAKLNVPELTFGETCYEPLQYSWV